MDIKAVFCFKWVEEGVARVSRGLRVGIAAAAGQTFCAARIKKSFERFGVQ